MKIPLKIEPTLAFPFNNKLIAVAQLPAEIRSEIETMDRFHQMHRDAALALEHAELALQIKTMVVNQLLETYFKDLNPIKNDAPDSVVDK